VIDGVHSVSYADEKLYSSERISERAFDRVFERVFERVSEESSSFLSPSKPSFRENNLVDGEPDDTL
jgi:hypothetical protein